MSGYEFVVRFRASRGLPQEYIKVGDELLVTGRATVHSITADLVDVSSAEATRYLPGTIEIDLYSNEFRIEAGA